MAEAQARINAAHGLQDQRIQAQLQINAQVQNYNNSTTALQRGGEAIRGFFFGDGVNHLDSTQKEFDNIQNLEHQYNQILLNTKGPITAAQQQELNGLQNQVQDRLNLATTNAGLNVQHSLGQAARYKPVEAALFQTVYAGSSLLPGGVAIGATTKLLLDDLPNGRIRTNGNVLETGQDVALSMAMGGGNVLINKLDPTKGGTTTVLRAGASPLLEKAAVIGLEGAANALYSGGTSVATQLLDPNQRGQGIDWQRVGLDASSGFAGGTVSGGLGRVFGPALTPATTTTFLDVGKAMLRDGLVGLGTGTLVNGGVQLATTGKLDPTAALRAGLDTSIQTSITGGLSSFAHLGGGQQMAHPATSASPRPDALAPGAEPQVPGAGVSPTVARRDAGNGIDPSVGVIGHDSPILRPGGLEPGQPPPRLQLPGGAGQPGDLINPFAPPRNAPQGYKPELAIPGSVSPAQRAELQAQAPGLVLRYEGQRPLADLRAAREAGVPTNIEVNLPASVRPENVPPGQTRRDSLEPVTYRRDGVDYNLDQMAGDVLQRAGFTRGVEVTPNQVTISGHGSNQSLGSFPVPPGQSVTVRVAENGVMTVDLGRAIFRGNNADLQNTYARTYGPGEYAPNIMLHPPEGPSVPAENGFVVNEKMPLEDVLRRLPNGDYNLVSCYAGPGGWHEADIGHNAPSADYGRQPGEGPIPGSPEDNLLRDYLGVGPLKPGKPPLLWVKP